MVIFSFTTGCDSTVHKDFAFHSGEFSMEHLNISAGLRGKDRTIDKNESVRGALYELWLSIETPELPNEKECSLELGNIQITDLSSLETILISAKEKLTFEPKENTYQAFKIFRGLEIPYENQELKMTTYFNPSCTSSEVANPVTIEFTKDYVQRNISFWDTLLGI